jgi:hypothetical protein
MDNFFFNRVRFSANVINFLIICGCRPVKNRENNSKHQSHWKRKTKTKKRIPYLPALGGSTTMMSGFGKSSNSKALLVFLVFKSTE